MTRLLLVKINDGLCQLAIIQRQSAISQGQFNLGHFGQIHFRLRCQPDKSLFNRLTAAADRRLWWWQRAAECRLAALRWLL